MNGFVGTLVRRAIVVREEEIGAVVWSFLYFFLVLSAYFVIRPIRDTMGLAGGVDNLAWLFTGTLVGMLLLHPLYTALVARMPRRRFVPMIYRFFILNLVIFFLLLQVADAATSVWIGRVFFIWTSVFNLFVVTVFWSFMTDIYRPAQSKRIFGLVAVGGTVGAVSGSAITAILVGWLGPVNLLLVSALLLELAGQASRRLGDQEVFLNQAARQEESEAGVAVRSTPDGDHSDEVIGGGIWDGVRQVASSPYLLGIAFLMAAFAIVSTFLYFQRIDIVSRAIEDEAAQTQLFATMEAVVQSLTAIMQVFITARALRWLGVGLTLALLPAISMIGFGILGAAPVLGVVVVFEVLRRAANFALQRPSREVLYTVLSREEKYKAKNFNDTAVYRLGDQMGAWSYTAMGWLGFGLSALAFAMVPFSFLWLVLALSLGRKNRQMLLESERAAPAAEPVPV
ncbi:MAG: MFS transporter [Gemmatimonas sp.]|nr:MFS transporter [Gemmatimonas sp.]